MLIKNTFALTLLSYILISCDSDDVANISLEQLENRFHGKYEIISAFADQEIDADFDGHKSRNLLEEHESVQDAKVELRVGAGIFSEAWPIETIIGWEENMDSTVYYENLTVIYALGVTASSFDFEDDFTTIKLREVRNVIVNNEIDYRFVFPEQITIQDDNTVLVKSYRRIYTSEGFKQVQVTAIYKRYTKVT
ncbi:MAG: hypothetical protein KI790_14395 [Cyclobacteriaceae bacterium]|nr:hypothetical protein [Cyclobacteriaceae bacterium HetDA_MAG_MS6]